jgi:predicted enzyme related to lactoylglutathione lyase
MIHVVLDCLEPETLAEFWAFALGYRVAAAEGVFVVLVPHERGQGPPFLLQRVEEPKAGKNRMHIDIPSDDVEATARELVAHGATRVTPEPLEELGTRWITLRDPEGNEFDVSMSVRSRG